ncbi:sensor histidine kinase [Wukongibacter baidiensis]|uniref:sensor histidine kinase n=1 Tax=Wukongibacter baidiensis TaxID=1723361 RepID=UPI003D7F96EF
MNEKRRWLLRPIKIFFLSLLFYMAVYFENASGTRLYMLLGLFAVYIILGIVRKRLYRNEMLLSCSFLIDIVLVYLLEHNSRFLINYFFHSFYIVILLEVSLTLKRDKSLIISIISVGVSLIKYILLISYNNNLASLSQMAFFLLINALILVIANFAQYNRDEKEKKELLYNELLKTHKKLKEYSDKVEELAALEERNRIARDIHDTLGHNMTALIMQMEISSHMIDEDIDKTKELIDSAKEMARQGLLSVRKVVETLRIEETKKETNSIECLIDEFSNAAGIEIEFETIGELTKRHPNIDIALYRIVQESLTNAVRHGKATKVEVCITYKNEAIEFEIKDNGIGAKQIKEGYGIKGMKERITNLSGKVEFESGNGFIVKGYLPN